MTFADTTSGDDGPSIIIFCATAVLPVTCESRDGLRQRTTVVAVERNTKVMEAVEMDEKF